MADQIQADWERLLAAERHLQALVPGSVLVGGARAALADLDEYYPQENGASVLAEVVERLSAADPVDKAKVDLSSYKGLAAPWNDWAHLTARGRDWARVLADLLLRSGPEKNA